MPKLQAAVPAGAPPNALLRVRLPDGNEVNVRVPEGLKPGDEFIFEVSSIGEITSATATTAVGTSKGNSSSGGGGGGKNEGGKPSQKKKQPKNPKKNKHRSNNNNNSNSNNNHHHPDHHHHDSRSNRGGNQGGDHNSMNNQAHDNNNAPGFVTGFFNMYNQVYDILSHNNTFTPHQPHNHRQSSSSGSNNNNGSMGNNNNNNSARRENNNGVSRTNSRGNKNSNNINNPPNNTSLPTPAPPQPIALRPLDAAAKAQTSATSASNNHSSMPPPTFLDRELSNGRDFLTALGVGIFIGLSVVMGFLAGVLHVTPMPKDDANHSAAGMM